MSSLRSGFLVHSLRPANKKHSTRSEMTGLFFCLASAEGAGLLFCPFAIHPHTSVYSGFLYHPWLYTANAVKPRTGLCRRFSCDLSHSTAADTRPTQAAIIPPAPRLSVSQRRSTSSTYQIPTTRRTLHRSAQPPYYNKVYKSAEVQHTADHASPAACNLAPSTRRGSPAASGAEPLTATAVSLFGLSPDSQ